MKIKGVLFQKDKLKKILILALVVILFVSVVTLVVSAVCKRRARINEMMKDAELLAATYKYDEAVKVIDESGFSAKKVKSLRDDIKQRKAALVEYDGQYYHVFFHSLIVYPELAFDGDYRHEGYDMWMTTVSEFKAMLPQLYERGYVLYPLDKINPDEKILFPPGKKPLIISVDDVNYYEYMENDGFADRLVIDNEGNVLCEVKTPEGKTELSYEGDVMPILDQFVKEHPDFSYQGAKGVVAVTGYEGAFGYDFENAEGEEKYILQAQAREVAEALKDSGWLIACHSYTHNDYFKDGSVSSERLHYDTNKFKERIYDIVVQPNIYISPFGYHLYEGDRRLKYMKDMGYDYFCPVSCAMRTYSTKEGVIFQERFNLDRYNMRNNKETINELFFDVDTVYYKEK